MHLNPRHSIVTKKKKEKMFERSMHLIPVTIQWYAL